MSEGSFWIGLILGAMAMWLTLTSAKEVTSVSASVSKPRPQGFKKRRDSKKKK